MPMVWTTDFMVPGQGGGLNWHHVLGHLAISGSKGAQMPETTLLDSSSCHLLAGGTGRVWPRVALASAGVHGGQVHRGGANS